MSSYIYDVALVNKLKRWTESTDITITGPDETRRLFEVLSDKSGDNNIKFPMVCLRRDFGYTLNLTGKKPLSFSGMVKETSYDKSMLINAIPITITYQLDVYARYFREADEYMRNFVFNIINYPKINIEIKYHDVDMEHVANILPGQTISDTSAGTSERLVPGQFTRLSYQFTVDDAYLWDIRIKNNKHIDTGELLIIDKATNEVIVETYL